MMNDEGGNWLSRPAMPRDTGGTAAKLARSAEIIVLPRSKCIKEKNLDVNPTGRSYTSRFVTC